MVEEVLVINNTLLKLVVLVAVAVVQEQVLHLEHQVKVMLVEVVLIVIGQGVAVVEQVVRVHQEDQIKVVRVVRGHQLH